MATGPRQQHLHPPLVGIQQPPDLHSRNLRGAAQPYPPLTSMYYVVHTKHMDGDEGREAGAKSLAAGFGAVIRARREQLRAAGDQSFRSPGGWADRGRALVPEQGRARRGAATLGAEDPGAGRRAGAGPGRPAGAGGEGLQRPAGRDSQAPELFGALLRSLRAICPTTQLYDSCAKCATGIGEKRGRKMIELRDDALVFSSPEVHRDATFNIGFQRTLRIPDDGSTYPLPAGLGRFPLRHVDDFGDRLPAQCARRGASCCRCTRQRRCG